MLTCAQAHCVGGDFELCLRYDLGWDVFCVLALTAGIRGA